MEKVTLWQAACNTAEVELQPNKRNFTPKETTREE
jgi:hypothetical protein